MPAPAQDLARWIPRLLAAWRTASGTAIARPDRSRDGDRRGARHRRPEPQGRFGSRPPSSMAPPHDALLPDELKTVAAAVERLSKGLTRERELAGARYMDDARLLGAYLLFYWPVSYLQARGVLSELPGKLGTVLDLGSGPGPIGLAALDAGAAEVVLADRSTRALDAARALAVAAGEPLATRPWTPGQPLAGLVQGRKVGVVTMGHLLNELFHEHSAAAADQKRAALVEEALALVEPGGTVVVIEPALRETSRALLRVRDLLVARGFAVRAPCLFRGACPALVKESDWCHAERPVEPPQVVAQIAKAAGLRREAVKMSYLAVAAPGVAWAEPPPGRVFRIVSEPLPSKGRLRYMGCGPEGRMGLALQEKHVAEANRAFEGLLRGDVVALEGAEARGDGLALGEGSVVKVLAPAGAPVPGLR